MARNRGFVPAFLCICIWGGSVSSLEAQTARSVEITVTALDATTGAPIADATVVFLDMWGSRLASRRADSYGQVTFQVRRSVGGVRLRAGATGYAMLETTTLDLSGYDFFVLELSLDVDAIPIAPLEIVARGNSRRGERSHILGGFDHRVRAGFGTYFTRAEIQDIGPMRVTDLLRRVPGVSLVGSGSGNERVVSMNRTQFGRAGAACPVQIYMDGMLVTRGGAGPVSLDELVSPQDLEGLEIYRGVSTVPPEFLNENSHCGVVVVWSRRGGSELRMDPRPEPGVRTR